MTRLLHACLLVCLAVLSAACASTRPRADETDSLAAYNRGAHHVNQVLDKYLIEPAADVYRLATPEVARDGISNALGNLGEPLTFVHCLLQGDPSAALDTVGRFALNSTVGVGGLVQVTPDDGGRPRRDFGQTLGRWGVRSGPYLVLPLLGPSSLRDTGGFLVDFLALDAVRGVQRHNEWDDARIARAGAGILSHRAHRSERDEAASKPRATDYESVRDGYLGRRLVHVHGPQKTKSGHDHNVPAKN